MRATVAAQDGKLNVPLSLVAAACWVDAAACALAATGLRIRCGVALVCGTQLAQRFMVTDICDERAQGLGCTG
jgi:hypothetical protein